MSHIITFILGGVLGIIIMAVLIIGGASDGKDN